MQVGADIRGTTSMAQPSSLLVDGEALDTVAVLVADVEPTASRIDLKVAGRFASR